MLSMTLTELLVYTGEERAKWRAWFDQNPTALDLRMQPDGRFATVGALVDHIFLVEARHLARLRHEAVPEQSGLAPGDAGALFDYGARVRGELHAYLPTLTPDDAATARSFTVQSGTARMTPRKLLLHMALHEIRHFAQIALAVRQSGLAPPGNHDLFYSAALE